MSSRPRLKRELTPRQIKSLRKDCMEVSDFWRALEAHGYRPSFGGAFRAVFMMRGGRYVIKTSIPDHGEELQPPSGGTCAGHGSGTRMRRAWRRNRRRLLCPIVWGADYCVQRWVKECGCMVQIGRYRDSMGNNHTHEHGRAILFDY